VTRPKLGDRVGIPWLHSACGVCEDCLSGYETLCRRQKNTGFSVNGTLAEYAIATASHAIPLPPSITDDQAATLLCAGVTSYKALKETGAKAGDFVTIMGAGGGLGHLAIQYAKAMGFQVIAMDKGIEKLDFCKSLGADLVIDVTDLDAVAQNLKASGGLGSHAITCFATNLSAFKMSIDVARRRGVVVAVGLPTGSFPCPVFDIVLKGITIKGTIVGTRADCQEALDFGVRGLVKCSIELGELENIDDIFTRLRNGSILGRVVIKLE
jgi:propanol-preferring alcohol dehydrogenase